MSDGLTDLLTKSMIHRNFGKKKPKTFKRRVSEGIAKIVNKYENKTRNKSSIGCDIFHNLIGFTQTKLGKNTLSGQDADS